jgi:glycogen debranching enzyme
MSATVLKDGTSFAIFDDTNWLEIVATDDHDDGIAAGYGFYHDDMRLVRAIKLSLEDEAGNNVPYAVVSRSQSGGGEVVWTLKADGAEILYRCMVANSAWYHDAQLKSEGVHPLSLRVTLTGGVEDVFEIRHFLKPWQREIATSVHGHHASWRYDGKDGQTRMLYLHAPVILQDKGQEISFAAQLRLCCPVLFSLHGQRFTTGEALAIPEQCDSYDALVESQADAFAAFKKQFSLPDNLPAQIQPWIDRAVSDLFLLQGQVNGIANTQAGVPWFCTLFGRDSLIACEQTLAVAPNLARNTLLALASVQATEDDPRFDAQPGKIVHELRVCERGNLRDVPFGSYYGTVDATPLFVSLVCKYLAATNDAGFWDQVKPAFFAALDLIERELSDKPFLIYAQNEAEGPCGLKEKGWKDGSRVVLHEDGSPAPHPIAICEAQGYAYRAMNEAASLLRKIGDAAHAYKLDARAQQLQDDFLKAFWLDDLRTFSMAVDGNGKACRTVTSNPGHLLRTGIVTDAAQIKGIVDTLVDPKLLFSGWGIRTLSISDPSYEAASYQLGGVWPHDSNESLRGMLHVGEIAGAKQVFQGLLAFAKARDYRLPELVTGDPRNSDVPNVYADSCSPQAWSASIPFSLLQHLDDLL